MKQLYLYIFLCYYDILYIFLLADLIVIQYVLWQIAKDFLSLERITKSKSLATYELQGESLGFICWQGKRDFSPSQNWLQGSPSLLPNTLTLRSHHAAQGQTVQHLLLFKSVVSKCPHVSVQCTAINVTFLITILKAGIGKVFCQLTDTYHV